MLPPKLFDVHKASFGDRATQYTSLDHIKSVIEAHEPRLVLLCSAYMFALDKVLSRREVTELLTFLRGRNCRIVTTDPLLGLARELTFKDVDSRYLLPGAAGWKRTLARAAVAIVGSRAKLVSGLQLDDVIHVYPACAPDIDDGVRRHSFFVDPQAASQSTTAHAHRRWLFVLAEIDLHTQLVEMDLRDFVENILGLLRFAVAEGARPTLIAPAMLVDLLAGAVTAEMELHRQLPITEFRQRVLGAEYVFYWNAFSPSQLERLANEQPTFVFDRGYLSRAVKPFYDAAKTCYFDGWEPKYLDQRQLFSAYVLAHLAKQQRPALRALRERWQASPTPDELIRHLLETAEPSRAR